MRPVEPLRRLRRNHLLVTAKLTKKKVYRKIQIISICLHPRRSSYYSKFVGRTFQHLTTLNDHSCWHIPPPSPPGRGVTPFYSKPSKWSFTDDNAKDDRNKKPSIHFITYIYKHKRVTVNNIFFFLNEREYSQPSSVRNLWRIIKRIHCTL